MRQIKNLNVLERGDIERVAPSFYAAEPKGNVSDKYTFISTHTIATTLWNMGWMPTSIQEARANKTENRGFTKHLIRFSHPDFCSNEERIELVGVNSHNRAAAFVLMGGIFRMVCANGLIAKTSDFGEFRIKHIGDISDQVQEGVRRIAVDSKVVATRMNEFKGTQLSDSERLLFASTVNTYVNGEKPNIASRRLLAPRRSADADKKDLWTTYNVIQENVMKGGIRGHAAKTYRRTRTRKVKSIDKNVKLNQALWSLTEKMAEIKKAG